MRVCLIKLYCANLCIHLATYGGHLELSAFAHLTQRNVKVIQPGLVYVIEWAAGGDAPSSAHPDTSTEHDSSLDEREKRRLRRDSRRADRRQVYNMDDDDQGNERAADPSAGTVYVAYVVFSFYLYIFEITYSLEGFRYHDWEHFSSIRNLRGPHSGLPNVIQTPADSEVLPSPAKSKLNSRTKSKSKPDPKASKHPPKKKELSSITASDPATPFQIPLPGSKSPSPGPVFRADIYPPTPYLTQSPQLPVSVVPSIMNLRVHRSPKRSFDESSGSSVSSESAAKRTRSSRLTAAAAGDQSVDDMESTPGLSASTDSSAASSPASSPLPTTPPAVPATPPPEPKNRLLTRRQRKALGLPKPKSVLLKKRTGAGKIVIPGGKYKKRTAGAGERSGAVVREADDDDEDDDADNKGEWRTSGTGRLDVRGFKELKI